MAAEKSGQPRLQVRIERAAVRNFYSQRAKMVGDVCVLAGLHHLSSRALSPFIPTPAPCSPASPPSQPQLCQAHLSSRPILTCLGEPCIRKMPLHFRALLYSCVAVGAHLPRWANLVHTCTIYRVLLCPCPHPFDPIRALFSQIDSAGGGIGDLIGASSYVTSGSMSPVHRSPGTMARQQREAQGTMASGMVAHAAR